MLTIDFSNIKPLETDRLHLRLVADSDIENILWLRSNETVLKYIQRPKLKNLDEAKVFIEKIQSNIANNLGIQFAICLKEAPTNMLGMIGFHRIMPENYRAEIGYMLSPKKHRQGIMDEAIKAVINYGFTEMKLNSIMAITHPENIASQRLLLKQGFIQEGYIREDYYFEGNFYDSVLFGLLKSHCPPKEGS
jgi:[ribosomal protein S5]-alanine N-acetyltransferase